MSRSSLAFKIAEFCPARCRVARDLRFVASLVASLIIAPFGLCTAANPLSPQLLSEEIRDFEIMASGKPAGKSRIHIAEYDNGALVATTDASAKVPVLLYIYRYDFHGSETWSNGRLSTLDCRATDNGKKLSTQAKLNPSGRLIELSSGAAKSDAAVAFTTTFWRLPDSQLTATSFCVLDADRGAVHTVKLMRVGQDQININGQSIPGDHYRMQGGLAADLWFDSQGRLVRQKTVEVGYPIELRIVSITRSNSQTLPR